MPSWYAPVAAMTLSVRELIFMRPSLTMQTTTFFQPSLPHVLLRSRLHRCAMFFMTPCIERANSSSSSLYIVITMNSSVFRGGS
jgi:hypothetical protein